jgi:uncharacterized protein (TIGR03067 family)
MLVRLLALALLISPAWTALHAQDPEPPRDERTGLLGRWEIVELKTGAGDAPELVRKIIYRFEAKQQLTLEIPEGLGGGTRKITYTLNATKKPPEIDLDEEGKGVIKGIYKQEKDQLTLYTSKAGRDRPKNYEEKPNILLVLKRVPAAK